MNQMEIFKNPEFGSIRVIEENGRYLFCGADVAAALGYSNPRDALRRHCKGVVKRDTLTDGGPQQLSFIPEGDVYRLIVHSRLPSAERFERWVFDEVLPTIRRHGAYITPEMLWEAATSPEALMKLCSDLLAEREKNAVLLETNAQLQGKAFYFDAFIKAGRCTNLRITAKELEAPERRFIRFLLNERFVYRSPSGCVLPYAKPENEGLFCVKDFYSKALCAGDPRIKERMDLDVEVSRLKLMKADHQSKQYRLEDQLLKYFPEEIEKNKGFIAGLEADMATLAEYPHPEDGFAGIEVRGDTLTDKENAGAALLDACKEVKNSEPVQIGSYRGFVMSVTFDAFRKEYTLLLKGQMTHRVTLGADRPRQR